MMRVDPYLDRLLLWLHPSLRQFRIWLNIAVIGRTSQFELTHIINKHETNNIPEYKDDLSCNISAKHYDAALRHQFTSTSSFHTQCIAVGCAPDLVSNDFLSSIAMRRFANTAELYRELYICQTTAISVQLWDDSGAQQAP